MCLSLDDVSLSLKPYKNASPSASLSNPSLCFFSHLRLRRFSVTQAMEYRIAFEDYLPTMAERLGEHGLMQELEKGFHLLADPSTHTITLQSLKQNAPLLGMPQMPDCELRDIIRLGDTSGRGELDLHEFCVSMIRTSPALMDEALATLFLDVLSDDDDDDQQI